MALELLAGPFAVTDALGTVLLPENQQFAFYDDALGLCSYNATLDGYCIIQLDGRAYLRSNAARANRFVVDLQRPGEYLVHESLDEGMLYLFDKRAGVFGALLLSGGTNFVRDIQARALDRYLNVLNNAVRFKPLDNSGSWTTEATLSGTGSGYPAVSRTRIDGVLCLVYTDGQVVYYNVNAKAQHAGGAAIGANSGAWYSPKHDVFIALVANQVKIFANAVRPAALSNPVAETPLTKGKVSRVKVRLTGADGEACANELIGWSMAGVGSLANNQSTTDADGWSYNDYRAPVIGLGSATINAEARF